MTLLPLQQLCSKHEHPCPYNIERICSHSARYLEGLAELDCYSPFRIDGKLPYDLIGRLT